MSSLNYNFLTIFDKILKFQFTLSFSYMKQRYAETILHSLQHQSDNILFPHLIFLRGSRKERAPMKEILYKINRNSYILSFLAKICNLIKKITKISPDHIVISNMPLTSIIPFFRCRCFLLILLLLLSTEPSPLNSLLSLLSRLLLLEAEETEMDSRSRLLFLTFIFPFARRKK